MSREEIYFKLPVVLQNFVVNIEGARIQRYRYGKGFHRILSWYESNAFLPKEKIYGIRDERLAQFINYAINHVPHYRKIAKKIGIKKVGIRDLPGVMSEFPVLQKKYVQQHIAGFISEVFPKKRMHDIHTSGTTGTGLRFKTTKEAVREQWAVCWRYRRWHNIHFGTWNGFFGGRSIVPIFQEKPPFWRHNIPGRQVYFSVYHMSRDNIPYYFEEIEKRKIPWLHGYPSAIDLLASFIMDEGIEPPVDIKHITVGSENLMDSQARRIQAAFKIKPMQHYGLAEAVANISMCEQGKMHVDEEYSFVEFQPAKEPGLFRIIGTNFTNYATPLIKYDTGDLVRLSSEKCVCGRPGRIVKNIDGRKEDYIILKNGAKVGRLDHIFKDLVNIREAQLVQERPGEVIFRIVKGKCYERTDEMLLIKEAKKRLGENTRIILQYTDAISRSSIGKLRFVISKIQDSQI